ncbi:N-acyl-L-amino acid amidohydrolase [Virgisporangium aliadipatigenens]|uniref:N-acyl-L-amino acid amidohydrolase n=1 Tax=Virgisporangium aliadipatigenens TaxID=741659 RepID=A0A8J3YWH0_9ACTN|nr:amidohydrolase [Virgisporangium aliadipatigenens]GIJ51120.1 N-acyl-L-amino acid amidohydrolase [Virgisporangium aliadipatigenens]
MTSALSVPSTGTSLTSSWPETPPGADPLPGQLDRWLASRGAELVAVRRHLHAHPELSNQEFETAALVARELKKAGLSPRMLPKGNGVICDIGSGDRVIALRADLDALPLPDTKDVPYRSTVDGVCHACGHDVHTTVLLGTGLALAQLAEKDELPGRVRLLFQPAEEQMPSGAPEVIAAGGLRDVDAIFALHCAPQLPVGLVGVRSGPFTAAADKVEVRVKGRGGHTARPHLTADLVHALGRVIVDVPSLLDRRVDARAGISMVWGAVKAGDAANTIPGEGVVRGTVRVLNRDAWREAPELVTELVHSVVASTGADVEVDYIRGVPPVINDRLATAIIAGAAGAALGPERVVEAEISMGGEDFSFYLENVPGTMIRLGVGIPGSDVKFDIHQSAFDVDERSIGYGVRVMVHTALAALQAGAF